MTGRRRGRPSVNGGQLVDKLKQEKVAEGLKKEAEKPTSLVCPQQTTINHGPRTTITTRAAGMKGMYGSYEGKCLHFIL